MRSALTLFIAAAVGSPVVRAETPGQWMLELNLGGQRVEGAPLAWNDRQVHLLGRDGYLWQFAPAEASQYRRTSSRFRSYSPSEFRAELLRDLGTGFEVTGTGHYMVVHPRGQRGQWAERFEDLYRSFHHYFSRRGFRVEEPPFALVAIVCRDLRQFRRYAADHGGAVGTGVLGYYSIQSNRILLYDAAKGAGSLAGWEKGAATLIHEATHQAAFNTGVHSRYTLPPLWVAEGLATMFEARGVHDCRYHTRQSDRINRGRFLQFNELVRPEHRPELLQDLVASDHLFHSNPAAAYAESWALTFYLAENQAAQYADYLVRTSARPPFEDYTRAQRTSDFTAVFGSDWRMLEARLLRFMDGLR